MDRSAIGNGAHALAPPRSLILVKNRAAKIARRVNFYPRRSLKRLIVARYPFLPLMAFLRLDGHGRNRARLKPAE